MKFKPVHQKTVKAFTLAEVLAAMMFMAIVIPTAVEGLRIASLAGEVAQRKMVAARIANSTLNELKATGKLTRSSQHGVVRDKGLEYTWSVQSTPWTEDTLAQMTQNTVKVNFVAQGKNYEVDLSTLTPQNAL
jgi:type II secretory pathway pseudopilin PulG